MNIGDFLRECACYVDEMFIEATGRPLVHYNVVIDETTVDKLYLEDRCFHHDSAHPTSLRGFYEVPSCSNTRFGIDVDDEMEIELGFNTTVRKLGHTPKAGDLFLDCVYNKWLVVGRRRKDDMIRGQNRLVLIVKRYQESVTTNGTKSYEQQAN